jgi:hypothetical protein
MMKLFNNFSIKAFYFAFFLSILWDLYHPFYGKVFDILGYLFILCSFCLKSIISNKSFKHNIVDLFWKIPILLISIYSLFFFPLISFSVVAGILCSVFLPIYFREEFNSSHIYTFVKYLFFFLFFTQVLQIILYFLTGYNLDFGGLIGFNNSRNEGGDFFRASGILAEANAIVVTQSILFIMLNKIKRNTLIIIVYFISLIISFSMLGIGIAFVFFIVLQIQSIRNLKFRHIFTFLIVFILLLLIFNQLGYLQTVYDIYKFRLDTDSNDISLYLRLFRPTKIPTYELLIPHVYDIENEIVPSNAYYIGLYFWGIFFIFFIYRILFYFDKNYILYLVFLSILLSYQMYSSLLFWIFISFLISNKTNAKTYD